MEPANSVQRDSHGRFVGKKPTTTSNPPDLVSFRITNPIVYIKYWWKRIMANEGIEFRLKVRPITALAIAFLSFSLAFGLGSATAPTTTPTPSPTPNPWKETAIKGVLKQVGNQLFLITTGDEAVTLQVSEDVTPLIGKKVLAVGSYNQKQKTLIVRDIQNLELLPTPTVTPTPEPTLTPTPTELPM